MRGFWKETTCSPSEFHAVETYVYHVGFVAVMWLKSLITAESGGALERELKSSD